MKKGKVGRPGLAGAWAVRVRDILRSSPGLSTAEVVRRLRGTGCPVGKSALYQLVALCRLGDPSDPS
jgi:hypothetical protein